MLVLAAVLFGLGVLGFLLRRNVIVVLASVELLLNAANLSFLAGARMHSGPDGFNLLGPVFAVFVILVAAAEAAVGLAIVIALYRLKQTVHLDQVAELKG
ncbi:MAG: NADH-quinone oxidoreductase subunit NuoK [Planctomycetaceae bacterium]|nr:NADH-quinone oxidoreductase subunit NuoK [Planctomycetaceae bacterium]